MFSLTKIPLFTGNLLLYDDLDQLGSDKWRSCGMFLSDSLCSIASCCYSFLTVCVLAWVESIYSRKAVVVNNANRCG